MRDSSNGLRIDIDDNNTATNNTQAIRRSSPTPIITQDSEIVLEEDGEHDFEIVRTPENLTLPVFNVHELTSSARRHRAVPRRTRNYSGTLKNHHSAIASTPHQIRSVHEYELQLNYENARNAANATDIILAAIEPPDHNNLSIYDTLWLLKRHLGLEWTLQELFSRTGMSPFTLWFKAPYEAGFAYYIHRNAIRRIRYTFFIGFIFLLFKYVYGAIYGTEGRLSDGNNETKVLMMHFCVTLPIIFIACCATMYEQWDKYCEAYTAITFVTVAVTLTGEKLLEEQEGPVLALFVMFIPVFGMTRLRFPNALATAFAMFLIYMISNLWIFPFESTSVVLYQGFNYLAVIAGGIVSHYREEVLRRRNFILHLPFESESAADFNPHHIYCQIKQPRFKKQSLLDRKTLKFKNDKIERVFYSFWYLIDPFPFAPTNAGALHKNVYRTIRYAVGGVILGQVILAFQDLTFLRDSEDLKPWVYEFATLLRFALVTPLYASTLFIMYKYGTSYYYGWIGAANETTRGFAGISKKSKRKKKELEEQQQYKNHQQNQMSDSETRTNSIDAESVNTGTTEATSSTAFHSIVVDRVKRRRRRYKEQVPLQHNYVRRMQMISTVIVFIHGMAMGMILLWYSYGLDIDANAAVAPSYFLGLLNAILFPHRSGFRVRYKYASISTFVLAVTFGIMTSILVPLKVAEYSAYVVLTVVLGMMISYEEESLRRTFFIRRAVRITEYYQWYTAAYKINSWATRILLKCRKGEASHQQAAVARMQRTKAVASNAQMAMASKYGMFFEAGKAVFSGFTAV